jgi:hypothetical protein
MKTDNPTPPPPYQATQAQATRPTTNPPEPAAGGRSSIQDFRERHADKIDMGKQKIGGVTSRFNTFVEDRKFSANANKRIPRPPPNYSSPVESSPSGGGGSGGIESAARNKKPPPPPPKRAEIRAPPVAPSPVASSPSSTSPAPPPVPLNSKPR